MNEWYSSAMVGLAISGATDWVWMQCRVLLHEYFVLIGNVERNKDF